MSCCHCCRCCSCNDYDEDYDTSSSPTRDDVVQALAEMDPHDCIQVLAEATAIRNKAAESDLRWLERQQREQEIEERDARLKEQAEERRLRAETRFERLRAQFDIPEPGEEA